MAQSVPVSAVQGTGDQQHVVCPVCGFEYTHPHGTAEIYDNRPNEKRWSFRIPMWCESGHEFDLLIEQHKGQTFTLAGGRPDRISQVTSELNANSNADNLLA